MKTVIVAHHCRREQTERLASTLSAHIVLDEIGRGALWGHRKALEWCAAQDERCVIMEDDALPVPGFEAKAQAWLDRCPDDLVSFYLGTGRPPQWQAVIAGKLREGGDHITLPQLIHGVCYSVPPQFVAGVLERLPVAGAADFAIGNAWCAVTRRPVIYPVHSLVDHEDGPSVENHPDGQKRTEPRRAWRLEAPHV